MLWSELLVILLGFLDRATNFVVLESSRTLCRVSYIVFSCTGIINEPKSSKVHTAMNVVAGTSFGGGGEGHLPPPPDFEK